MKILICGGKGQLGRDCVRVLKPHHRILAVDLDELDITQPAAVGEYVQDVKPDILLNCAGFTAVDACETQKELAYRVNALGPEILARCMHRIGGTIIHISTDYVFDGAKPVPEPYIETEHPNPLSQYGLSKQKGEQAVRQSTPRHVIIRTAWLYGLKGQNFLKTMLALALTDPQRPIRVVNDQYGSPTWAYRLAVQIGNLIKAGGQGIYHATAEGHGTWYELASAFLEQIGVPHCLAPCTTNEYPRPATRPQNAILENSRLKSAGIHVMKHWRDDLNRFIKAHGDALLAEAKKRL